MARLTVAQKTAFAKGAPVRQTWAVLSPINAAHSSFVSYKFEDGYNASHDGGGSGSDIGVGTRVTRAGSRKIRVWNPHPQETSKVAAPRYSFEVSNGDGYFFMGNPSAWNPIGLYNAEPEECFITHLVKVWDDAAGAWSTLSDLSYTGRVIRVQYTPSANPDQTPVGQRAVITCEQSGAWDVLRQTFTKDHADIADTDGNPGGTPDYMEWTVS